MKEKKKPTHDTKTHRPFDAGTKEAVMNVVSDLYLKGFSYRAMAKQMEETLGRKVSLVTIGNYVGKLLAEWKAERVDKLEDMKTVELSRIHKLENTYWEGWERSLAGSTRKTDKQKAKPGKAVSSTGQVTETMNVEHAEKSVYTEETFGDPRFLAGIQWCISMRCKILGIEAPIEFKGSLTSKIHNTTVFKTRSRNKPA